jgi:hypothetical protein
MVYVANYGGNSVTVINVDGSQQVPITTTAAIQVDAETVSATAPYTTQNTAPVFTVTASSDYSASSTYSSLSSVTNPAITALYYWVDDQTSMVWSSAPETTSGTPGAFTLSLTGKSVGLHILYYYAAYGDEGVPASSGAETGNSPEISNLNAIVFEVPGGDP